MHPEKDIPITLISKIREKANRFLVSELKSHNMPGLAPSHGDILWALFKHGGLSMKGLAGLIDRDKSTVTALVNKLIFLGYVRKEPDIADSRVTLISLTDAGEDLKDDLIEISQKLISKVYKTLSEDERDSLIGLLTKVNDNW
ncbi:MAG: MarR family transcriptional regulator [Deltaproteobacteria bacterium]|nr:MarR family transcriptional regulator [Deltaproteobacteria bacterium]